MNLATFLSVPVLDTLGLACGLLGIQPLTSLASLELSRLNQGDYRRRSGKRGLIVIQLFILNNPFVFVIFNFIMSHELDSVSPFLFIFQ